jgi:hypothetical protein
VRPGQATAAQGLVPGDLVMSVSASTWVPVVTAGAGLIAGLVTGLGWARRWASKDRLAAWRREDSLRWRADRLQTYGRLISALDAWDAELRTALGRRKADEPFDAAEWERHDRAVTELVGLVFLMASEKVRDLTRRCRVAYGRTGRTLARQDAGLAGLLAEAEETARATRRLMEAMSADLGLGGDRQPVARAAPRPTALPRPAPPGGGRPVDVRAQVPAQPGGRGSGAARPAPWPVQTDRQPDEAAQ